MEIIPIEDMTYKDGQIAIDDVSITFVQSADCTESEDEVQSLTISTRNNGVARFINLKTDGWSIDGTEELVKILEEFKKRAL